MNDFAQIINHGDLIELKREYERASESQSFQQFGKKKCVYVKEYRENVLNFSVMV